MILILAIISGLLQATGYGIYIKKVLSKEVDPNPATWLMFAYGTATLTVLEWDRDASLVLLVLPVVCAVLSIWVAYLSLRKIDFSWEGLKSLKLLDRFSIGVDIALTVGYVAISIATGNGWLTEDVRTQLVLTFLVLSNLSTVVQFVPLLQGAWKEPETEHWLPWTVWSSAYLTLGTITYLEEGTLFTELMLYPLSGVILHGLVAIVASRKPCARALNTTC